MFLLLLLLKKLSSLACLCQVSMSLMMNPPQPGDESYEQYKEERAATLASLRRRAHTMTDAFNACEGVTCNFTEGAMYSFPRLDLPQKVGLRPRHPDAALLQSRHCLAIQASMADAAL